MNSSMLWPMPARSFGYSASSVLGLLPMALTRSASSSRLSLWRREPFSDMMQLTRKLHGMGNACAERFAKKAE